MGIILLNFGTDVTLIAVGGYKKTEKAFFLHIVPLYMLAKALDAKLHLVSLDEAAWDKYQREGEAYLLRLCNADLICEEVN